MYTTLVYAQQGYLLNRYNIYLSDTSLVVNTHRMISQEIYSLFSNRLLIQGSLLQNDD